MPQKLIFSFFFLIFAYAANAQRIYPVVFYNLENLFDPYNDPESNDDDFTPTGSYRYTPKMYAEKLGNMAYALQRTGTDKDPNGAVLIGVAEVENNKVLNDLVATAALKKRGYKYIWYNSGDNRGIDLALLYNPAVFKPLQSKLLPLKGLEDYREPLYVKGILAGDTVHVLVNHWPSRRDGKAETAPKRKIAATVNRKQIDEIRRNNPHARILLMGDLNDNPDDESITTVLAAKSDAATTGANSLYNPFAILYTNGRGTAVFHKKWDLFDQIILSAAWVKGKGLQYYTAEIYDRPFLRQQSGKFQNYPYRSFRGTYWNRGYSDHFPVVVYLKK